MRALLQSQYPNGYFGDPALYVWESNGRDSLLFDCGDLTRFSTRQLLRVSHIFLSHCHIDHFFGFDLFLRIHVGSEKTVTLLGPPETSLRVGGKLQGYTWNLIRDQNLEFIAIDLDPMQNIRTTTRFHAKDGFRASSPVRESWNPKFPVHDRGLYWVHTALLDHRTPSLAYSIEEKETLAVDKDALAKMGLRTGSWINELKELHLFEKLEGAQVEVPTLDGSSRVRDAKDLARQILIPRPRHKIAYMTDGAISVENRARALELIRGADLLYAETCFLESDRRYADETKHFTARFVGDLAREAGVRRVIPTHFSKRYLDRPEAVLQELSDSFLGLSHPELKQQGFI